MFNSIPEYLNLMTNSMLVPQSFVVQAILRPCFESLKLAVSYELMSSTERVLLAHRDAVDHVTLDHVANCLNKLQEEPD
jgi:hypothetical protein